MSDEKQVEELIRVAAETRDYLMSKARRDPQEQAIVRALDDALRALEQPESRQ